MKTLSTLFLTTLLFEGTCLAARCTTTLDLAVLSEYEGYVLNVEQAMNARFAASELSWIPDSTRNTALGELNQGKPVRRNLSLAAINDRIADRNGTIIHWIGAIRIRDTNLTDLKNVLQDYGRYSTIYEPIIHESQAQPTGDAGYEFTFGCHYVYRFASLFPQIYAFRVKSRTDYSEPGTKTDPVLLVRMRADEIRESESGVPGRNDLLERYHDHGILWALNTYWVARPKDRDVYLEFETITLARSVKKFACRIGLIPVPKSIVSSVMKSIPGESLEVMLTGAQAECERRVAEGATR